MTTYSAVVTTGIYCRPGCGAKPKADNVRTYETAAAAEAAGFRACLRCRPYRIAGSLPWDAPELVCRAVRLVIGGALDEGSEAELGRRLGLSSRHLRRLFHEHLGVTPDQLARSRRAHFARRLLDDTDLAAIDVAFASGFGSLRQFNRTMREVFRASPHQLRARRRKADRLAADGGLTLRLPIAVPYDWPTALTTLAPTTIPGISSAQLPTKPDAVSADSARRADSAASTGADSADRAGSVGPASGGCYRRTIGLDGDPGLLEVRAGDGDHLLLNAHLPHWEGLIHVVERVRRLLGLDTGAPGTWSGFETGAVLVARQDGHDPAELVRRFGTPVPGLSGGLTHVFPAAEVLAEADGVPVAVAAFAKAVAAGDVVLDGSAAPDAVVDALTGVPGVDRATAEVIAARAC